VAFYPADDFIPKQTAAPSLLYFRALDMIHQRCGYGFPDWRTPLPTTALSNALAAAIQVA
jgi:hypothetical protein